jgi:hypothetical protein
MACTPVVDTVNKRHRPRTEEVHMSLYMDVHTIAGGVSAADVADAHVKDLQTGAKYEVSYLRYWVDETAGKIFCLVEADSAEDANTVHREAHGLVADEIYPVSEHN